MNRSIRLGFGLAVATMVCLSAGCATGPDGTEAEALPAATEAKEADPEGTAPAATDDGATESAESDHTGTTSQALTWRVGWHYVTWGSVGLRRWNASSCGGTVHCNLSAGQWVYWNGGPVYGCGGTGDVYVHNTPCGYGGYVRADALN